MARIPWVLCVGIGLLLWLWPPPLRAYDPPPWEWEAFISLALAADTPETFGEAEQLFQELQHAGKKLDPGNTRLVWSLTRLASFHRKNLNLVQAERYQTYALQLLETRFGLSDLLLVTPIMELAAIHLQGGRLLRARQFLERALAIVEESTHPAHLLIVRILEQLATLHLAQHAPQEASRLHQRIADIREQALMMETPGDAIVLAQQARRHLREGDIPLASSTFQQSKDILLESSGPYHSTRVEVLTNLATIADSEEDYAQSVELLKSALAISENMKGTNHPDLVSLLNRLAAGYQKMGKPNVSRPILMRTLALVTELYGQDHKKTAEQYLALGDNLRMENQPDPAVDYYNRAMAIFRQQELTSGMAATCMGLGKSRQMQGKTTAALRHIQEGLALMRKNHETNTPEFQAAQQVQTEWMRELEEIQQAILDGFAYQVERVRERLLSLENRVPMPMHTGLPTPLIR